VEPAGQRGTGKTVVSHEVVVLLESTQMPTGKNQSNETPFSTCTR